MRKILPSPIVSFAFRSFYFRARFLVFLFPMFNCFPSYSQARLLKDLATELAYYNEHHNLIAAGNAMYFAHNGGLWKSNGKPSGTEFLGSFRRAGVGHLTYSNGSVFFISDDGSENYALWKTDGTPAGTVRVKTISPFHLYPGPEQLIDINGTLFFVATTESRGRELWRSDGTTAGTVIVKDILPGSGGSEPNALTYLRGRLFFSADDGIHGRELWSSDGTSARTNLFKDIRPGSTLGSDPSGLRNVKGTLYFAASDGNNGQELWKSNGTTGGTVFVKDIRPGPESSGIENITEVNGLAFFSADDGIHGDELWKSNGSTSGTVLVKDLNPGPEGSNSTDPQKFPMGSFKNVNGVLFFTASKNADDYIYRSNGTASGTWNIQQAYSANYYGLNPGFVNIDDYVYFFNATGPDMYDPYVFWRVHYKGTRPIAVKQFEGHEGYYDGYFQELLRFKGALYFFVRPIFALESYRLMVSDGTTRGTRALEEPELSSRPAEMVRANNLLYITSSPNTGDYPQLYRTDGTAAGTFSLGRMHGGMKAIGNKLFYAAHEPYTSAALYVTEGTRETTRRLVGGSVAGGTALLLTPVNGWLYYYNEYDGELWRTNGTAGDEVLIGHASDLIKIDNVNGTAFMLALPGESSLALWRTDPDGAPERLMAIGTNYYIDLYTSLPHFSTAGISDVFYFVTSQHPYGESIWRSDGTASGTYRMISVRGFVTEENMEPGDQVRALTVFNNQLYFSALSIDDTWGWYTALDDDYFMHVANIPPVIHTVVHNNLMYVFAKPSGQDTDVQLWISDGTAGGTRYLTSFPGGGAPDHAIINNVVYFSTQEGTQLIRTDGTECGTFPVNTGVEYAFPMEALGNNLIFGAFTPSTGMEPFIYRSINNVVPPADCEDASSTNVARSSGILTPYPNPFASEFTLRVNSTDPNPITVAVFTTSGFPVETFNDIKANTDYPNVGARWPNGMYIVKVNAMGRISTHLVVKR